MCKHKIVIKILWHAILSKMNNCRYESKHKTRAIRDIYVRQERGVHLKSVSGLPPKFYGDFLVHGYICDKIFMKIWSVSLRDISQIVDICPILQCWRILQKIPRSGPDDFQNLTSLSLTTDTRVTKFSWRSIE